MLDHQWRLTDEDGSVDLTFGTVDTGIQTSRAPDLGQRDVRNRDVPRPREDGIGMGTDFEEGTVLSFEANVLTDNGDWQGNSDLLNTMRAAWSARAFRSAPGQYAILQVQAAGRVRRCYGRPRRFAEADSDLTHEGYTGIVADFQTFDGKFYDDAPKVAAIQFSPPTTDGFVVPADGFTVDDLTFPDLTGEPQPGAALVETETWPVIEVQAGSVPVTDPIVTVGSLTIRLNTTIPAGMSVTLDPRPWSRKVLRSDGANLAGHLTWETPPMGQWLLEPGSYEVLYRGTDASGTSTATVSWREAFHRP